VIRWNNLVWLSTNAPKSWSTVTKNQTDTVLDLGIRLNNQWKMTTLLNLRSVKCALIICAKFAGFANLSDKTSHGGIPQCRFSRLELDFMLS